MSECQANIKKEGLVMIGMSLNIVALHYYFHLFGGGSLVKKNGSLTHYIQTYDDTICKYIQIVCSYVCMYACLSVCLSICMHLSIYGTNMHIGRCILVDP